MKYVFFHSVKELIRFMDYSELAHKTYSGQDKDLHSRKVVTTFDIIFHAFEKAVPLELQISYKTPNFSVSTFMLSVLVIDSGSQ